MNRPKPELTEQQLEQTVVALASKPSFLSDQLDNEFKGECKDLVILDKNQSLVTPRRPAYLVQGKL